MKLIIIIPAKNEEATISAVIKGLPAEISGVDEKEVLVIDDGSTDSTAQVARETGALVISHLENKGVGAAFSTGIKEALSRRADLVLTIDADGQFDPAEIPSLILPVLEKRADFVLGSRFAKGSPKMPKIKLWGNKVMAKFISYVASKKISDASCGFRAYSKKALLHLNLFGSFTYTQETILNLSFKGLWIMEVPVTVKYFPGRVSDISGSLINYVFQTMKIILRTIIDYKPLKFFGGLGVLLFSIGAILDIIMFLFFLGTGSFSPHIIVGVSGLIFNFFGLTLFIIGLVADMLNRVRQNQERMLYYQKKKIYGE
ncbi:MAG: glycosyltransferase family 2 protein [Candidatus Nealsonbacteria bacterium]|nr:glycosyltransferase family 2 protein [Candidatus Nealsonbacteria bacterium]